MAGCARLTQSSLIQLAQRGDPNAFSELVENAQRRIERIVRAIVHNAEIDPEDVLQDSLVHAFGSIPALRNPTPEGFLSWFAGIVRHRLGHALRAQGERERPRIGASVPWSLQRRLEPEVLEAVCPCGRVRVGQAPRSAPAESVGGIGCVPRVSVLMREGFGSSWDTLGVIVDRASPRGLRRSVRRAMNTIGYLVREPGERA